MRFKTVTTTLAALLSTAAALPTSENGATTAANTLAKRTNKCGDSTFNGETSGGSPLVSDCEVLRNNIVGDGSWRISTFDYERDVASYGTCKFVVQAPVSSWSFVGNEDIRDIIRDSISRFASDGRVGARGLMNCEPGSATSSQAQLTWWWIRHT
jgi:hypothetical protein